MESTIFGKMGSNHIFQCHSIITPTYFPPFFLERGMGYMNGFRPIFGRFRTRKIFYRPIFGSPTTEKSPKNRFFQNFLKIDLNEFRYRFRVQNGFQTPQRPISGHISIFWTVPATLKKFEFLAKIVIFAILTDFWWFALWPIIWPEMSRNMICGRKWLLWTPRVLLHTLDDHLW